jgi:hypothetical protein
MAKHTYTIGKKDDAITAISDKKPSQVKQNSIFFSKFHMFYRKKMIHCWLGPRLFGEGYKIKLGSGRSEHTVSFKDGNFKVKLSSDDQKTFYLEFL